MSLSVYVREAVPAGNDRLVAEKYLQSILDGPSRHHGSEGLSIADIRDLSDVGGFLLKGRAIAY